MKRTLTGVFKHQKHQNGSDLNGDIFFGPRLMQTSALCAVFDFFVRNLGGEIPSLGEAF